MVSDVFLEQLRNACPLEEIARTYVDLKRRGRTYVCNCPFHSEKTPSFTVFPDTQSFYCFGCGAGGDVITFIQQIENLDFMDAVKLLAQNSGMTVPEQGADEKQSRMRKRILAVNRAAANFYYRMLTGSDKRGLQYFIQRHLTTTTIKKYGLGFAPETWDALSRYLLQQGFTEEELERYGFGAGAQMIENEAQTENAQQEIMSENVSQENHMHEEDLTLIQGIIDVFWIEDDGITVLDYKTDRVDTAQELIDRYATQLKLYADALERVFATRKLKVKEILIYSFRLEKLISIE